MIGVVGDSILDVYYQVKPGEWDPSFNVQAYRIVDGHACLGEAASVAAAVAATGETVTLFSMLGIDNAGTQVLELLARWGIRHSIRPAANAGTCISTRWYEADRPVPVRFDLVGGFLMPTKASTNEVHELAEIGVTELSHLDGVIVADYGTVLNERVARKLINHCVTAEVPVLVDPTCGNPDWYFGCTIIKMNLREARIRTKRPLRSDREIFEAAHELRESCGTQIAVVTLGEHGAIGVSASEERHLPATLTPSEVRSPVGAGDAFAAGFMVRYGTDGDLEGSLRAALETAGQTVKSSCTCPNGLSL